MTRLFYLLNGLLLAWVFLALSLIVYSVWLQMKRARRAEMRSKLREAFQNTLAQTGDLNLVEVDRITHALRKAAGGDRHSLREMLLELGEKPSIEFLKLISSVYEALGFVREDLNALQRGNRFNKMSAAMRLGRMRSSIAAEVLMKVMKDDPDKDVRFAAVCALAEIGEPQSVSSIVQSLSDADGWQVLQVADKLLHVRADLTRPLLDLLQSSGAVRARREAVAKTVLELIADLGQRGCERLNARLARAAAMKFLSSDSVDMRARALRAVAALDIETYEELEALIVKLSDKDWEVRAVAAKTLGVIGKEQAIPALAGALTDEAWWVRHNSAHALAMIGEYGIQALREQCSSADRFARDIAAQVLEDLQLDGTI